MNVVSFFVLLHFRSVMVNMYNGKFVNLFCFSSQLESVIRIFILVNTMFEWIRSKMKTKPKWQFFYIRISLLLLVLVISYLFSSSIPFHHLYEFSLVDFILLFSSSTLENCFLFLLSTVDNLILFDGITLEQKKR